MFRLLFVFTSSRAILRFNLILSVTEVLKVNNNNNLYLVIIYYNNNADRDRMQCLLQILRANYIKLYRVMSNYVERRFRFCLIILLLSINNNNNNN